MKPEETIIRMIVWITSGILVMNHPKKSPFTIPKWTLFIAMVSHINMCEMVCLEIICIFWGKKSKVDCFFGNMNDELHQDIKKVGGHPLVSNIPLR
jgi:hypothetical protein